MDLGDYAEWGDALDERYLIDRAEHEAHAEGNEEEPDDDDVPFEECGAVVTPTPLLELIDRYAGEVAGRELGDQHHKADRERAEIVRRLDLVRERTADDDGTTTMILEILNGTYPPPDTASHEVIQFEECGAVAHLPGRPPQPPCRRPAGHTTGPDEVDYHSNGLLKWPVKRSAAGVLMHDVLNPEQPRALLDLLFGINGLVEHSINAGIFRANGNDVAADDADAEVSQIEDEVRRRCALADADHSLMWRSHLDNNDISRRRQRSLLRQAAANPGDRVRAKVAEHARNWRTDSPGGTK